MPSINNNLMALHTANTLNSHYGRLTTSVERLSSGLRINSSADDAAGLAIRELMRADMAALNQGMRNANDAISMLQVADAALGIIDEKLIRMKELAEQAATGTYDSTQRLMINSEFAEMGAEIDRIAKATDFNGIKLLDGSLHGEHDGSKLEAAGAMKIHFGSCNDSAEDYYYIEIGSAATKGLGLRDPATTTNTIRPDAPAWITENATIDLEQKKIFYNIPYRIAGQPTSPAGIVGMVGIDYYELPVGLENVRIESDATGVTFVHKPHVNIFTKDGQQLTGINPDGTYKATPVNAQGQWPPATASNAQGNLWWDDNNSAAVINKLKQQGLLAADATYQDRIIFDAGDSVIAAGSTVTMVTSRDYLRGAEIMTIDKVTEDLVFLIGGHGNTTANCNHYSLTISADLGDEFFKRYMGGYLTEDDEGVLISVETQEKAQKALVRIDDAIVSKDKVRANLGAMQNRLENTVSNLSIQSLNLGAAESRISDADVALEMTRFVCNQVLTQSAVAMLGQANSYPHMLLQLLG